MTSAQTERALRRFCFALLVLAAGAIFAPSPIAGAEVSISDMAFSADGRYLALLEEEGRLLCWDLETLRTAPDVLTTDARGTAIAWHPDRPWATVACDRGRGWDCVAIDAATGKHHLLTSGPEHDSCPSWRSADQLLFLRSAPSDPADIWTVDLSTSRTQPYLSEKHAQWALRSFPRSSGPVGYYSNISRSPEVRFSLRPGRSNTLSGLGQSYATTPIPPPVWSEPPRWMLYLDAPKDAQQTRVVAASTESPRPSVWFSGEDFRWIACNSEDGRLYVEDDQGLIVVEDVQSAQPRARREDLMGLPLGRPVLGRNAEGKLLAVVVDKRVIAVRPEPGGEYRLLTWGLSNHLALIERLLLKDRQAEAESLYKSLMASLKDPGERAEVQLHRLAMMRKYREPAEIEELFEDLADEEPPAVDPLRLAFERALFDLFENRKITQSRLAIEKLVAASEAPPREANEAMVFLATQPQELVNLYVDAQAALRREDFRKSLTIFKELARRAPENPMVIEAILSAVAAPYGNETCLDRPNPFTEGYLSDANLELLDMLEADEAPVVLLHERMYMQLRLRRFDAARQTALRILDREGLQGLGVKEFLRYYIESERSEWSVQDLMGEVLLDPVVRDALLEQRPDDNALRALLYVAEAKLALLEGDSDDMKTALDKGRTHFESLENATVAVLGLRSWLWLFAARHHERLRQWEQACEDYDKALRFLWLYAPARVDRDIFVRAARDEARLARDGDADIKAAVWQMQMILRGMGDPLVNPTRHPERLAEAARQLENLLGASPEILHPYLRRHLAGVMLRLRLPLRAQKYVTTGLEQKPTPALYAALLLTRAQCDSARQDHWRALHSWQALEKILLQRSGREMMRLRRARELSALGRDDAANVLWRELAESAQTPAALQEARSHIDRLEETMEEENGK